MLRFLYIYAWVHVKSLQSYPILWDHIDSRTPGSSVYGVLQAKETGEGCHALLQGIWTVGLNLCFLHLSALSGRSLPLAPPGKASIIYTLRFAFDRSGLNKQGFSRAGFSQQGRRTQGSGTRQVFPPTN